MNGYLKNPTQEEKILSFLQERGEKGVFAWEITDNLKILQYNARIFGLRKKGYNIINKEKCHFILMEENMDTTEEIQKKLRILRQRYLDEPENREIIRIQGLALKIVLKHRLEIPANQTFNDAKEVFSH